MEGRRPKVYPPNGGVYFVGMIWLLFLMEISEFFTIETSAMRVLEEKMYELFNERTGEKNDDKTIGNSNRDR